MSERGSTVLKQKRDILITTAVIAAVASLALFSALSLYSYALRESIADIRLQNQIVITSVLALTVLIGALILLRKTKLLVVKENESVEKERKNREQVQLFLDSAPFFLEVWNRDIEMIGCSQGLVDVFGLKDKDEYLREFSSFFPEHQPCGRLSDDVFKDLIQTAFLEGVTQTEWMGLDKEGNPLPFDAVYKRVHQGDEDVVVCYATDLRPIKSAMNKEQETHAWTRMFFDTSPVACILFNEEMQPIDANLAALYLFVREPGKTAIESYPDHLPFNICPQESDCNQYEYCSREKCRVRGFFLERCHGLSPFIEQNEKQLVKITQDDNLSGFENFKQIVQYDAFTLYGKSIRCEVSIIPVNFHGANGYSVFYHDLQDKQRRMAAEAESRAKTRFLTHMSHEFRTPMNAIIGTAEIQLQKDNHPPETEEAFLRIHNSSKILLGLINDILDLSKVETGKISIMPAAYDLANMIADTAQLSIMYIESRNIDFVLNVDWRLPARLVGDELRIKQILNNFLSNAFKYTQEGEVVLDIGMDEPPKPGLVTLSIKIADTGQGMTKEQVSKLFVEEYTRFNLEQNHDIEGHGLGMFIAYSLIRIMGGEADVESEQGVGTTFTIRIPQTPEGDQVIGIETAKTLRNFEISGINVKDGVLRTREPMPYGHVLVVDDVETNLQVIKGLLALYRLTVETASSGREALSIIESGREYDIIFMDHMMPEMDGIETLKALRGMGYRHPVVALTANVTLGNERMFMDIGFSGFVPKPINHDVMERFLMEFIYEKQPPHVVKSARAQFPPKSDSIPEKTSAKVIKFFLEDAGKSIAALEPVLHRGDFGSDDCQLVLRQAHAMKGALANIKQHELSRKADILEQAGHKRNAQLVGEMLHEFVEGLQNLVRELSPEATHNEADNIPLTAQENSVLRESMLEIAEACKAYDKKTAKKLIAQLRKTPLHRHVKKEVDEIDAKLLRSEFEEAEAIAEHSAAHFLAN